MVDIVAHVFLIGLLFVAVPILIQPSPQDSSAGYRYRAVLLLRAGR